MKLTEKKLDQGKIALSARATVKEVEDAFATAYLTFVNSMGLKPEQGKTVNQAVEEQLGIKDLYSAVRNSALEALIPYAIDKSGLMPAYPPAVTECSALRRGQEASFTLEVQPKQRYELSSYDPVEVTVPKFEMDTTLIDRQIEEIAKRNTEYVRAADQDRAVESGDAVLLEMESWSRATCSMRCLYTRVSRSTRAILTRRRDRSTPRRTLRRLANFLRRRVASLFCERLQSAMWRLSIFSTMPESLSLINARPFWAVFSPITLYQGVKSSPVNG